MTDEKRDLPRLQCWIKGCNVRGSHPGVTMDGKSYGYERACAIPEAEARELLAARDERDALKITIGSMAVVVSSALRQVIQISDSDYLVGECETALKLVEKVVERE